MTHTLAVAAGGGTKFSILNLVYVIAGAPLPESWPGRRSRAQGRDGARAQGVPPQGLFIPQSPRGGHARALIQRDAQTERHTDGQTLV